MFSIGPSSAPAQQPKPRATLPIGGENFHSTLTGIAGDWQLSFDVAGEPRQLPAAELVSWGAPVEPQRGKQLLLAGGGVLIAEPLKSDGERLLVESAVFGELALPLELLAGILFHPSSDPQRRDELAARVHAATEETDRLVLDNGDELTGSILTMNDRTIELESSVGKVDVETARVAAAVFNPTLAHRPGRAGVRALVGFADGSRFTATALEIDQATARIGLSGEQIWTAPAGQIVFLQPLGGRAVYLSDLQPAAYRHVPFLELAWPYRLDRNVRGTQLRAGGRLYLKGIGMHSASRLTFAVGTEYRRFAAELAIDDHTQGRGSVVFRVFADTKQVYASPLIRGGTAPISVTIDIPEATRALSLIVDFGERGDELDHANWLNARLIK